ncbi:MAG TPA: aminotransferase class IV [Acidimicrobiales bacterium]|nr:aminotransferase class IV [Acidimicrobiales bacterium]
MSAVWIDGALLDEAEARVSPLDHGLLTGDGIFETLRVARSRPFAPGRHLERLARSAAGLRLPCPPPEMLLAAMDEVIRANGLKDGRLRITVTGGPSALGSDRGPGGPTVIVAGGLLPAWPPAADVVVAPWPRNERGALTGLKTISYGENVVALAHARDRGAGEALFANLAGNLCEGTGTNVFVGFDGRLVTPPLSAGCLAGVTRELLLDLVDVVEDDLPVDAIRAADEAFLTSSTRDVQPIRSVDGRALPACPGPLTTAAAAAFQALLLRDLDP